MRLKTYFATSVEAAMVLALDQLGPEAMIVNSRKTALENRHLGDYEVVFATDSQSSPAPSATETRRLPVEEEESVKRLHHEVSRLSSQIETLGRTIKRSETKDSIATSDNETVEVLTLLRETGFEDDLILDLIANATSDAGSLRFRVLQVIANRLRDCSLLGRPGHGRKLVAVVGAAGIGKSTMVAKLAARFGIAARRPCQILSLDSDRIGAAEPLRFVAGLLGIPFHQLDDPSMLANVVNSAPENDLLFIDTPAFSRDDHDAAARFAAFVDHNGVDVHLAISASMKRRDVERSIQSFRPLTPAKLILTRLDETEQLGTALQAAIDAQLPISFLSNGPRIPEDMEVANASQLARRIFLPAATGLTRKAAA